MAKSKTQLTAGKPTLIDHDPRDVRVETDDIEAEDESSFKELVAWVTGRVDSWKAHRKANYDGRWDEYERLWRAIYSPADKGGNKRKSERSQIITPALSEAVENSIAEIEEAVFGRGDFFDVKGESKDSPEMKEIVEKNKKQFREDLERTGFTMNTSEALVNGAVYGTGIAELLVDEKIERDIEVEVTAAGGMEPTAVETEITFIPLRSVNPRNFCIDPNARDIDSALGCAVEEDVGSHIINAGQERGDYRQVKVESAPGDPNTTADPQTINQFPEDTVPVIRYYGLVPKRLLFPPEKTVDLFAADNDKKKDDDPVSADMVEAIVVIANGSVCLKAIENPYLMKDRPILAFQWDIVPGRFWGRGVCEKGATPQKLLDAEMRSRADALAFSAAPMMGIDALRLPRGFKMEVYPGRSVLTNGPANEILHPFQFGTLDQSTWQQAAALDQMVQRATGAIDGVSMAQSGASGEARSGAVSMSLSGIVKRSKRTLMHFIDQFLAPAMRKLMWRYMQYNPGRYAPINFTFVVSSTMGIMQREYETASLTSLLATMEPQSMEYKMILMGIIGNTGLQNRTKMMQMLESTIKKQADLPDPSMLAAQQGPPQPPPVDPVIAQLEAAQRQLQLAKTNAETARLNAQTMLISAQARNEQLEPMFKSQEIATKGIYSTPEDQQASEFDRRMKVADMFLKKEDIESNERIATMQVQGSVTSEHIKGAAAAHTADKNVAAAAMAPAPASPGTA